MDFNFYATTEFICDEFPLKRTVQLPFDTRLDKLAFLLFASLFPEEELEHYSFLLRFGEDIYVSRKEEEESQYRFSDSQYHILEEEKLINPIMRQSNSASFELVDYHRQENIVFRMEMGPIQPKTDQKLELIAGQNRFIKDLQIEECDFSDLSKTIKKNLKKVLELNR